MPYFIVECSDNIREEADLPGLFAKVNPTPIATGIFPLADTRSRVHWVDTWQMADGQRDYVFVHMTLRIGAGRSLESRQQAGGMLFELIKTHFAALVESRLLTSSFEIGELHPMLDFKQDDMHASFKQRADCPVALRLPGLQDPKPYTVDRIRHSRIRQCHRIPLCSINIPAP